MGVYVRALAHMGSVLVLRGRCEGRSEWCSGVTSAPKMSSHDLPRRRALANCRLLAPRSLLAERTGPRRLLRIRPKIDALGPKSAPKPETNCPKMPRAVPTNRHKPTPIDFGPASLRFDHDPKLVNCQKAQPSWGRPATGRTRHADNNSNEVAAPNAPQSQST